MKARNPRAPGEHDQPLPRVKPIARLDIRGPVLLGVCVIALFFGAGIGGAAIAPIDKGVGMPGTIIVETKVKSVQHQRGGTVAKIHAAEGQQVAAGDLLVTFDTVAIDEQIAALRLQAEAALRQLDLARQEADTMAELLERKLAARSRVLGLQRQVAEIEKEVAALNARITVAQQELDRAVLRAPVSGRILTVSVHGPGAVVQPGGTLMEIVPEADRLVIEGRLAPIQVENVKHGMPARVWLTALSWREQAPLEARLAWVSADSVEDERNGTRHFLARVELKDPPAEIARSVQLMPGMRAEILLLTGQRTLLDQLLDPLVRNVNRAFRE